MWLVPLCCGWWDSPIWDSQWAAHAQLLLQLVGAVDCKPPLLLALLPRALGFHRTGSSMLRAASAM
jgi:hypothetical protein